jgi:3-phenylpropionate/cinnamic acid dioxygenase small subunit
VPADALESTPRNLRDEWSTHEARLGTVDDATERAVERFLHYEAELVDDRRFNEWLALFDDELTYRAPVRLWRHDTREQVDNVACLWNDDKRMLSIRVERIDSGYAWTEQPPSVTRHFVSNVRVFAGHDDDLHVRSNLLVTRSRGPSSPQDVLPADRFDILRRHDASFRIARRTVILDSTDPIAQNLAIFF